MIDGTAEGTWTALCEGLAFPLVAARLPSFRRFRPVERIGFCAHWTDWVLSEDQDIRDGAGRGEPSSHAIKWAAKRGISEVELRECYTTLTTMWCAQAAESPGDGSVTH
ncbi:MAG: hypothetical protein JSR66_03115 [Proteobacteria bacterium]|nr:hypothetical protein [Pseudomonadota bacterium]